LKISQVRYSRLWNTGDFTNESHSFTADLEPSDSAESIQCRLAVISQEVHDVNQAYRKLAERIHDCTLHVAAIDEEIQMTSEFCEDQNRLREKTQELEKRQRQWQAKKAYLEKNRDTYLDILRAEDWERAKEFILTDSHGKGDSA
jgi:septal ring factor EnvC (AmiA/AmiB activator)